MAKTLATKYRPTTFQDVCSQESIIKILERQIESSQFKNAYLFCGASGCGKTTVARIFANAINNNQGSPIEIDAASHNGVDNAKLLVSSASQRSIDSTYKVVIIDECHTLTSQAWQVFLKCIEEPPQFTIFIFCTTDVQKIPDTILNRVMRFNFNRLSSSIIKDRLEFICKSEGFTNYTDTCDYISRIAGGCMRDAISMIDKCADYSTDLNINTTLTVLGNYSYDTMFDLVNACIDGNESKVVEIFNYLYQSGADLVLFINQFLSFVLDIDKYAIFQNIQVTSIPAVLEDKLKFAVNFNDAQKYYSYFINKLLDCKNMIKTDTDAVTTIEIALLNIARCV